MKRIFRAALLCAAIGLAASPALATPIQYNSADGLNQTPVAVAAPLPVASLPPGVQVTAASGNVANGSAAATLAAVAAKTTYITGFQCTASGATTGLAVNLTVVGVITGTMTYTFVFPAGVLIAATPLIVSFPTPVQASAANTAIVVTLPAGGAGNTSANCAAEGFQL